MALATQLGSRTLHLNLGGRRWEVLEGKAFRMGRHPSNDLCLNDVRVSRFHAEVFWLGGFPYLRDLDSFNGTFVDGLVLKTGLPLEDGQLLSVGRWDLKVEVSTAPALLDFEDDEDFSLFTQVGADDLVGSFVSQSGLHRICLDMEYDERTGTLEIASDRGSGAITVCLGQVVAATCGTLSGLAALERLLRFHAGSYRYTPMFELADNTLDLSIKRFLREGFWATTKRHRRHRVA
jgi:hypothetical protein